MRLILENRFVFDGSIARTTRHVADAIAADRHAAIEVARPGASHAAPTALPAADIVAGPKDPAAVTQVVFIDPRVADWQTLASGAAPGAAVILVDPSSDGIAQVTRDLGAYSNLQAVGFVTYGQPGEAVLGASAVTAASLSAAAASVATWRDHMADGAEIDFWGCDVGAGAQGQQFVDTLHAITGVSVGASTDATGSAAEGGDWTLERTDGIVAARIPFDTQAVAAYGEVLDRPDPVITFIPTTVPATALLGAAFTESLTFTNAAASAVGYAPFVDVFLPSNSAEAATLNSASYLGSALTVTTVTLSSDIAGHVGTLGALHPLATDDTGAPLFVAAPAGYVAGDTLYVVTLPFGSFTPGEPAAQIDLSITLSSTSELTSLHPSAGLNVTAIGGFALGADPLNDPTTDPSLRGTSSTESASASDAGNGLVAASSDVGLLEFTTTIATNPGDDETATGPDFVDTYQVTINPAPATSGDAITHLQTSLVLPNDVVYTGGNITVTGATGTASFVAGTTAEGGTVNTSFASLSASGTPTVIDIPVYVPQSDASGAAILDPASGAPVTSNAPISSSFSGQWNPLAGSVDYGTVVTVDGTGSAGEATFVDKSLAVQEYEADETNTVLTPGDEIAFTINFQVSDYYEISNLVLQAILSDGLTVDTTRSVSLSVDIDGTRHTISLGTPTSSTTDTVNGQTVAASGSAANWSFTRDDGTTGQTSLSFAAGNAIAAAVGSSVLGGGATGYLTFYATALDKYTNTNSLQSIAAGDTLSSTSSGSATLLTPTGAPTASPAVTVTDGGGASLTVPEGHTSLTIVAVNGVAVTGAVKIAAGDVVTYDSAYALTPTEDYDGLTLQAFLPLPVLSVSDPDATGGTETFTQATASGTTSYPASGQYTLLDGPSGAAIQGVTTNATANSVTFNLGDHSDTSNASGGSVDVLFSVTAGSAAFANGLLLTTQGEANFTNAAGTVLSTAAIQQQTLEEPELVSKSGIVSVVNASGVARTGAYTVETTGAAADPTAVFAAAGSTGSIFAGSAPTSIGAVEDLNVAGIDGGDTVRIATTVQNVGSAPDGAWDVTLSGTLPTGFTTSEVTNFTITRGDGAVLTFTAPNGSAATLTDYFNGTGILVQGPNGTAPLTAAGDPNNADILFVTYDLAAPAGQSLGAHLSVTGAVDNYAAVAGGVAAGDGFVDDGTPVGGSASSIADDATVSVATPASLALTIGASDDSAEDNADSVYPNLTVVPGESREVTLTLTLPEGAITNDGSDVKIVETLPTGMTVDSGKAATITFGDGVTATGTTSIDQATGQITFDLGSQVLNSNVDAPGTVTVSYLADFPATSGVVNGSTLTPTATLQYDGAAFATETRTATLVVHEPVVAETIYDNDAGAKLVPGQTVTYTVRFLNSGKVDADDLSDVLNLSGVTYVGGSLESVSGGVTPTMDDSNTSALKVMLASLAPGATATFQFQATVNPNQAASTADTVTSTNATSTYTDIPPATSTTGRTHTMSANDTLQTKAFVTPTLTVVGESNGTATTAPTSAAPLAAVSATVGDIVTLRGSVGVPEGANSVVLSLAVPTGLAVDTSSFTLAFISPDGDMTSSTLDPGGTTAALQVAEGTTQIAGTTFNPTYAVPAADIDTSTAGVVKINLGTLANNDGSTLQNYVVVEFNAVVANVSTNVSGAAIASRLTAGGLTSAAATETVKEPKLTIAKTDQSSDTQTGAVEWKVTVTNTGNATAYDATLNDPQASNLGPISSLSSSGAATNLTVTSGAGTSLLAANFTLAAGQTETFTYTVQVTDPTQPVPDATATVTWMDLSAPTETARGTTTGASGTADGGRDGSGTIAADTYTASVVQGISVYGGEVWAAIGSNPTSFDPALDTPVAGVEIEADVAGSDGVFGTSDDIYVTTQTNSSGLYSLGLVPDGAVRVTVVPGSGQSPVSGPGAVSSGVKTYTVDSSTNGLNFALETEDPTPTLTLSGASPVTARGSVPMALGGNAVATDPILAQLVAANEGYSYAGTSVTVQRDASVGAGAAPNVHDVFGFTGSASAQGANVVMGGVVIGTYTMASGKLIVTFNAEATAADIDTVLGSLTYTDGSTDEFAISVPIQATFTNSNANGDEGLGGAMTSAPIRWTVDVVPAVLVSGAAFVEANDTASTAVTVDPSLVVEDDATAAGTPTSATVAITGGYVASEDTLSLASVNAALFSSSWNATTGVLTITAANGGQSVVAWQQVLRAVVYDNTSEQPHTQTRQVTFSLTDTSAQPATVTSTAAQVTVAATNDSPTLTASAAALSPGLEDAAAPSGAVGTPVSTIAQGVADGDGADASNGATPGLLGIAIVGADTSKGVWWYSTDAGATWTIFAQAGGTAISGSNALHLVANDDTLVYFQSTAANFNGALPNVLTFRGWDQFDAVPNGTLSALPSGLGTGTNTPGSSYSASTVTLSTAVTAVNDAPIATGAASLAPVSEDVASAPGSTVAALFGANFSDAADGQQSAADPTGSVANTLAGVAIIGNATPASEGAWVFSTDGGTTWTAIPASVSDTGALVLGATAKLAFQPAANFNGAPSALTVRLIDNSDTAVTPSVTGAALATATAAYTGVDVAGANDGGATAVSAATVDLNTGVTAVNNAPIATAAATLAPVSEDVASAPGDTVADLFGGNFSDAADGQQSAADPTGSVANTLAGVTIIGNATPASEGAWVFSTDGGTTWTAIPASVSDTGALVLGATAKLAFQPAANFNGAPSALTVRLIDNSDTAVTPSLTGAALAASTAAYTGVDVSGANDGGATAVSAATIDLNTGVTAVNNAPIAIGVAALPTVSEDAASPAGDTVADLFAANFSDAADQQQSPSDPTGSVANTLAGVVITGDTTPASEGTWRISTDGGTTWNALPANLSDTSALVLGSNVRLSFLPAANFNGAPPPLTVRLIDSSSDVVVADGQTGADLLGTAQVLTGVDVAGNGDGGTTAVSAATITLGITVSPVNNAPTTGNDASIATVEDASSSAAVTVAAAFGADFSDAADQQQTEANPTGSVANVFAGVAIVSNTAPAADGTWRYSLDGGNSWTAIATDLADANALVLSQSALVDFVPAVNFNGAPPALQARVIDSSATVVTGSTTGADLLATTQAVAGVDVSGANNGGSTAVSADLATFGIAVTAVNNAPVASGTAILASGSEDVTDAPGATVASLFAANFSDAADQQQTDANPTGSVANTLAGVAIVANATPAGEGTWRYSTDGGQSWTAFPSDVSDAHALVLSASALLSFQPPAEFNGAPAPLSVRLIDDSDTTVAGDVTGATLAASDMAIPDVDVSGANDGGITAVSAATVALSTSVTAVNDAPVATGSAALAPVLEDAAAPSGDTVADLFGANFSDAADQQQTGANPTGSVANVLAGVAIVADAAPAGEGTWRYSTDGGQSWTAFPQDLSETSALVLGSDARLSFLPGANFNGVPGGLTARLVDSSDVAVAPDGTTGADLLGTSLALPGVDVSGAANGGSTAVSTATVALATSVTAVNNAPVAEGTADMPTGTEDAASPSATVADLFAANFSDAADQQQTEANPTGSVANVLAGVAIVSNATPASEGAWRYSIDGGQTWTDIATDVNDGSALVLSSGALIEFAAAPNFNGQPAPLEARLVESSAVVPVSGTTTGADLLATTQAIADVDVSGANNGTDTSVSAATVQLDDTVLAINNAPVATGSAVLASVAEDTASPAGVTIAALFGANLSDAADQQQSTANPTGSVADALAGAAFVSSPVAGNEGTWRYSTDGGQSWTAFPSDVSETNALVLSSGALVSFLPVANFNGAPPALAARLIDSSATVVTGSTTGADLLATPQILTGVDAGADVSGGATALSLGEVTLSTAVTAVNDAPVASGASVLASVPEDVASAPGSTVAALFGANFSDAADGQQSAADPTGSVANTLAGVAIIGNATPASEGAWVFSTDGGTTWTAIPASVSDTGALVLGATAKLAFQPAANFNGAPSALTVRLIDNSDTAVTPSVTGAALATATAAYTGVDVAGANDGGATAVSAATVDLNTGVTAVNNAPIATAAATLAPVSEDVASAPGDTVADLFGGNFSDAADGQQSAADPTGSVANTLAGVTIIGNATPASEGAWVFSTDGGTTWTAIPASVSDTGALVLGATAKLAFQPAANFNGAPSALTVRLIDNSDTAVTPSLTGAALAASTAAYTGVDVSGANDGGATAVSAATIDLNTGVTAVNNAPIAIGVAALPTVSEDAASPAGDTVADLFAANFSDAADQQQSPSDPTGSVANTLAGVVITGDTTPASEGTWRISTDGGTTWNALPANLSDTSALVLGSNVRLSFLPAANFNGAPPPLTVRLIDSSSDVVVADGQTGADLLGTAQVLTGVDVAGNGDGGTTAVSAATITLGITVSPVNNAPTTGNDASIATVEDASSSAAVTVAAAFGADFSDAADQQQTEANPTGSVANVFAGVAIVSNTAPAADGTWRYSLDGGNSWTAIATDLADANALVLSQSALVDFVPAVNFNGAPPALQARVIDSSATVVTGSTTGADLLATTQAVAGVDVSGANNGGSTAVSADLATFGIAVTAVNNAPVASGTAILASGSEDVTDAPGATVASLFAANFSDAADQQQTDANPTGSVANTLAGVAIVANATPAGEGTWRYSTDGGQSWTAFPSDVSETNALVLSSGALVSFLPAANFNGAPPALAARLIDSSATVVTGSTTGADLLATPQALIGVDAGADVSGGATALSLSVVTLSTAVTAVNDAPVASSASVLASVPEDVASAPGSTVAALFGANFSDAADGQQSAADPTGSVANTLAGIAVVSNATPAAEGTWRYSTDGGQTWTAMATDLSDSHALVLSADALVSFQPAADFNGAPAPLVTRLIDSSTDVTLSNGATGASLVAGGIAITGVDVAVSGGDTAISSATVELSTAVTAVNDAPVASSAAVLAPVAEGTTTARLTGMSVAALFGSDYSDAADQQRSAANPTGSVASPLGGVALVGNAATATEGTWVFSTDGGRSWTAVPTDLTPSDALLLPSDADIAFLPAAGFNGSVGALTARPFEAVDAAAFSDGRTGAQIAADSVAVAGVDVSGTRSGGTTAVAAADVAMTTSVAPTHYPPTLAAPSSALLDTVSAADIDRAGSTVASLLGQSSVGYSDAANQSPAPDGTRALPAAAIAVVGDAATSAEGTWQYSSDGGKSWTDVPAGVSDAAALVLPIGDSVRFLPAQGFSGEAGALAVRVTDETLPQGMADIGAAVGLTWSTSTTSFGISVTAPPTTRPAAPPILRTVEAWTGAAHAAATDLVVPLSGEGQDWLVGQEVYRFVVSEHFSQIDVSADVFVDSDPDASLDYAARQANGLPLPDWLSFDPRSVSFSGTPPAGVSGTFDLTIVATDSRGIQATAEVHLFVGREPKDLLRLLSVGAPGSARTDAATRGAPARPSHRPVAVPAPAPAPAGNAPRDAGNTTKVTRAGKGTLSGQIRDAGAMGQLAARREFLKALAHAAGGD